MPLRFSLAIFAVCLTASCSEQTNQTATLTFIQHSFVKSEIDETTQTWVYYFENDEIARTVLEYDKGYFLTQDDIDYIRTGVPLNYVVPTLNGDGYWSFTSFMADFDEQSGLATQPLRPQEITNDLTLHFGIYG